MLTKQIEFDIANILTPNKFIPLYLERHYQNKADLYPHSIELHLTSACNYRCKHCSYRMRNKAATQIKESKCRQIIEEIVALKPAGVYFSGGGEPTTLKNWDKYAETLLDKGIDVALITNGSLIRDKHANLVARFNYMAVSVQAANRSTYEQITGGRCFEKLFTLPERIKSISASRCLVGSRSVLTTDNYLQTLQIYNRCIDAGYDYVIFIPVVDYEGRGIGLEKEHIDTLMQMIAGAQLDAKVTNLQQLFRQAFRYYDNDEPTVDFTPTSCNAVSQKTNAFVNYDGGIYLCQPYIGTTRMCIGNLYQHTFKEIWNSERANRVA